MPIPDRRGDSKNIEKSSPSPNPVENGPTEYLVAGGYSPPPTSSSSTGAPLPDRQGFQTDTEEICATGTESIAKTQVILLPAQLTKEETDVQQSNVPRNASSCFSSKPAMLPRDPSCVSEDGMNISDFERVWETSNDIIDKPTAIASAETLNTSSSTPRSFTSSRLLHSNSLNSSAHPTDGSHGVKRSYSFADSSALNSVSVNPKNYNHHQRSPSYGSTPMEMGPLKSFTYGSVPVDMCPQPEGKNIHWKFCTREVELHVRLPQMEIEPLSPRQSLLQDCPSGTKVATEDGLDQGSDEYSVRRSKKRPTCSFSSGIGEPSVYHALVVIFLEFFAWGLLTAPMIIVLKNTFPDHTFLMNGIIMGIKGILSFLSAPLIGALSDVWGRKFFLFITVFFTCLPIPFMKINTWWYFALISMSGVFAVTYSIVFAYVADVTDPAERHHAYGLVSASFAASLVTSPALGAYLSSVHSDDLVVGLATAIAVLDIFFILVAVPESLPEKLRMSSTSTWSTQISWEQADPFTALWKVSKDRNILLISVTVFLSYLPEAGQLSCFFVYLQLVMGFGKEMVATFIAVVGIMSVVAQTALLGLLIRTISNKKVISVGLVFELLQLLWYGFGSQTWMMWAAGILAAISSITYPAISAYVSTHTDIDKQGVVQGIVTGMRGLCAGLGPAVFGFIFYLFHVDLNQGAEQNNSSLPGVGGGFNNSSLTQGHHVPQISPQVPGPPFVFGAMLVLLALTVSAFIPEGNVPKNRKQSVNSLDLGYNRDRKKSDSMDGTSQPLMNETGVL